MLKRQDGLCCVEVALALDDFVLLDDLTKQGAARDVLELEVEVRVVLEGGVELHDERTLVAHQIAQDLPLVDDMISVLHLLDVLLRQHLEGARALCRLVVCPQHFGVAADSNDLVQVEFADDRLGELLLLLSCPVSLRLFLPHLRSEDRAQLTVLQFGGCRLLELHIDARDNGLRLRTLLRRRHQRKLLHVLARSLLDLVFLVVAA